MPSLHITILINHCPNSEQKASKYKEGEDLTLLTVAHNFDQDAINYLREFVDQHGQEWMDCCRCIQHPPKTCQSQDKLQPQVKQTCMDK